MSNGGRREDRCLPVALSLSTVILSSTLTELSFTKGGLQVVKYQQAKQH